MECPFAQVDLTDAERQAVQHVLAGTWLAAGPETEAFEQEFATFVDTPFAVCVNSGSSGLLLALESLHLPRGSEVLVCAAGFPSTIAPVLHLGLTPTFIDAQLPSHNPDVAEACERLRHPDRIRAVLLAHTLGNPFDLSQLAPLCYQQGIALIEDCCEAVGSQWHGTSVGRWGDCGVFSFYPSHQMTALGGGGMVVTNSEKRATQLRSLRDWGKRYTSMPYQMVNVPTHYNVELSAVEAPYYWGYVYETIGYNMKLPDANAACGRVQLTRLPHFQRLRQFNWEELRRRLRDLDERFLPIEALPETTPCWFGYPLTVRAENSRLRNSLGETLESAGIRHRPFFAGNLLRQPPYAHLGMPQQFPVAEKLMRDSCFVGVWQGLTEVHLDYMSEVIHQWSAAHSSS